MQEYFETIIEYSYTEKETAWERFNVMMPLDKAKFIKYVRSHKCTLNKTMKIDLLYFLIQKSMNLTLEFNVLENEKQEQ